MTVPTINEIIAQIDAREKAAYQKGWQDAVANIMAAASQGASTATKPPAVVGKPRTQPLKPDRPIVTVIEDIIKERPGQRGSEIFREAVKRVAGSDFKTMDRTGRTALLRLKKRGRIKNRQKRWYPVASDATETMETNN